MEVVILCGGRGTRLRELTVDTPKPLVTVDGDPIVCHIMRWYAAAGFSDFTLCLGYRAEEFHDYFTRRSGAVVQDDGNALLVHTPDGCRVRLVDTGRDTMTGGRVRRVAGWLRDTSKFQLTYGDAVADVDLRALVEQHTMSGLLATMTIVHPRSRFGIVELDADVVTGFVEKPIEEHWVNGGFFVLDTSVLDHLRRDDDVLEHRFLSDLAAGGQLGAYRHRGFWQCMDTPTDHLMLEQAWRAGDPPWAVAQCSPRAS
jgi:glucose-1-phosphate cytidylyltransferase